MRPIAVPVALLRALAVAAGTQRSGSFRGLVPPPEPELDFDDLGEDEGLTVESEVGPVVGIVARRRRPPTARSYMHAAKAQGAFGMDVFKVSAQSRGARDGSSV